MPSPATARVFWDGFPSCNHFLLGQHLLCGTSSICLSSVFHPSPQSAHLIVFPGTPCQISSAKGCLGAVWGQLSVDHCLEQCGGSSVLTIAASVWCVVSTQAAVCLFPFPCPCLQGIQLPSQTHPNCHSQILLCTGDIVSRTNVLGPECSCWGSGLVGQGKDPPEVPC